MKKRIIAMLLLVAMTVSLFTACGANPSAGSNLQDNTVPGAIGNFLVPENGYDGSEVTIKFAHTMGAKLQEVLNQEGSDRS